MIRLLFLLSLLAICTSTVYTLLVGISAWRFERKRSKTRATGFTPPVSLLKPLHGSEPDLEHHLETFFTQEYPHFEIIFCAPRKDDGGLATARRVAERYPRVPTQFLVCGLPPYPNAKVWSLECMKRASAHDILVVSDSDVSVKPGYIAEVVDPFMDDRVGLVTCVYRGVDAKSSEGGCNPLWSQLEAVGMSIEMTSGVLVADMLAGMNFALGPTMAVRRRCLDNIGGFASIGEYHADDFVLGNHIAANGFLVVLSHFVVEHHVLNATFVSSIRHQIRWMTSTRFSRPRGHLGTVLTFGMPPGLFATGLAFLLHKPALGILLLGGTWALRVGMALLVGRLVVGEMRIGKLVLLYPLRDMLGFGYWMASYMNSTVQWRGARLQLLPDGRMRKLPEPHVGKAKCPDRLDDEELTTFRV